MSISGSREVRRPRTPSNGDRRPAGLGINGTPTITTEHDYDIHNGINDSPRRRFDSPAGSVRSLLYPTVGSGGPDMPEQFSSPQPANVDGSFLGNGSASLMQQPFNFVPQQYVAGSQSNAARGDALGKRRGHKYRHSSVHASAMDSIVLPPPPRRAPLAIPGSLPMPTRAETWFSMTREQTMRFVWSLCHLGVSAFVQFSSAGSLSMTALSRLLLFDAAGAIVCVIVDVMGNFEVWQRSSIRHPFGLARADVLAGFGMAVFIGFMGLDIISHGAQHSLENLGSHVAHSSHDHGRVGPRSVDLASILGVGSTLISAILLKNHSRIGRAMRFELIAGWGKILGNPSHFLTLSCSLILLILPFLDAGSYQKFDIGFAFLVAILMIGFGVRLGTSLASMLLMSFRGDGAESQQNVREVIRAIETDPGVSGVEEARFWQVHYGLCMANLKLRYRSSSGSDVDEVTRVRQRIESMIRQRLAGSVGMKWEITTQMSPEMD